MPPLWCVVGAAVVLAVSACGSDELDLADLSDRTVPVEDVAGEPVAEDDDGSAVLPREAGRFVDGCSVLTEDAVAAATALTVIGSEESGGGCEWFVENIDPSIIADDAITYRPFPGEQFASQRAAVEQGLAGEEIPGLGDDALYIGTETLGAVWVLVDDVSFEVGNQFAFTEVEGRPYQEALAAAIVDQLR